MMSWIIAGPVGSIAGSGGAARMGGGSGSTRTGGGGAVFASACVRGRLRDGGAGGAGGGIGGGGAGWAGGGGGRRGRSRSAGDDGSRARRGSDRRDRRHDEPRPLRWRLLRDRQRVDIADRDALGERVHRIDATAGRRHDGPRL